MQISELLLTAAPANFYKRSKPFFFRPIQTEISFGINIEPPRVQKSALKQIQLASCLSFTVLKLNANDKVIAVTDILLYSAYIAHPV